MADFKIVFSITLISVLVISGSVFTVTATIFNDNVGLGTDTPREKLHVIGKARIGDASFADSGATLSIHQENLPYLTVIDDGQGTLLVGVDGSGGTAVIGTDLPVLQFKTGNIWNQHPASVGQVQMVIDNSGRVGIGTANPSQILDVAGNIRLTGNIVSPNDICIGACP